jgi:hypothetical protein
VEDYKDLARSVDYIKTRADLDHQKLAYYGVSQGAREAAVMLGLEKRLLRHLTSVLIPTSLLTPLERSRWSGRRFACYAPHVMPKRPIFACDFSLLSVFL